jgi:hypothetical protein
MRSAGIYWPRCREQAVEENSKSQNPNSKHNPKLKFQTATLDRDPGWILEFERSEFIWDLGFGFWNFSSVTFRPGSLSRE